jgi:hypothetical protein
VPGCHVREEALNSVEPTNISYYTLFKCRFIFSHVITRLSVLRSNFGPPPSGRGGQDQQHMHHSQQLQNLYWVVPPLLSACTLQGAVAHHCQVASNLYNIDPTCYHYERGNGSSSWKAVWFCCGLKTWTGGRQVRPSARLFIFCHSKAAQRSVAGPPGRCCQDVRDWVAARAGHP